jgi:tRNA nucleotidyltransferase (CCA-adding enzyme)
MEVYLVGGAVRDELLGRPVLERDWVVVGATPEQMEQAGYRPVGRDFPVFLHPDTGEEYALARTERKTARGYRGFNVQASPEVTLEQDLMRRDLTINAIAKDEDGNLRDPYGGVRDLEDRVLRHVSPAFVEDPVRVLRVARFAATLSPLGFAVAPATRDLMRQLVDSGELDSLVPERVWQETRRSLETDGPDVFFATLRDCGALGCVFPELDGLFGASRDGCPQSDAGEYMLVAVREAARLTLEPRVRFAALVAGVGRTDATTGEMRESGARIIAALADRLRIPNDYRDLAILVARFCPFCHRADELGAEDLLIVLEGLDAFRRPARLEDFLAACEADLRAAPGAGEAGFAQAGVLMVAFEAAAAIRPVTDGTTPGHRIGRRLREDRLRALEEIVSERTQPK